MWNEWIEQKDSLHTGSDSIMGCVLEFLSDSQKAMECRISFCISCTQGFVFNLFTLAKK